MKALRGTCSHLISVFLVDILLLVSCFESLRFCPHSFLKYILYLLILLLVFRGVIFSQVCWTYLFLLYVDFWSLVDNLGALILFIKDVIAFFNLSSQTTLKLPIKQYYNQFFCQFLVCFSACKYLWFFEMSMTFVCYSSFLPLVVIGLYKHAVTTFIHSVCPFRYQ
jgi:hypothetical protein